MTTPNEADIINAERQRQAGMMQEKLEAMGVSLTTRHFRGDSSYLTEYTLQHGNVRTVGPALDLALLAFVEKLLQDRAATDAKNTGTEID